MAKCKQCDYPYATGRKCPNCGSTNPSGASSLGGIVVILLIIYFISKCK